MALRMDTCGCENSHCEHAAAGCRTLVFASANGSEEEPVMAWIGPVCKACATVMGRVEPMAITPPYGTYDRS